MKMRIFPVISDKFNSNKHLIIHSDDDNDDDDNGCKCKIIIISAIVITLNNLL